ncbi:sulfate transport system permease protein [Frankineae bacterium MT45]|nr:sulfate transport system permease protein [Frankineae bacterium MT45]
MVDAAVTPVAAARAPRARRQSRAGRSVLRVVAVTYVVILVVVPLLLVVWRTFKPGIREVLKSLSDPLTVHAFQLTAIIAVLAVLLNTIFGIGVGLLLARYSFPGRGLLSAFIDLPIAISPIVVGLALILVYGPTGWFATPLSDANFNIIGAIPGMVLATVFVSLPLVVREIVPVLEEAGIEQEQAARCLGAGSFVTFRRITLPTIRWALAYGVVLSLARALGEYGAVLVVSGNVEGSTETATLRIDNLYEYSQQTDAAYAITFVLVAVAIVAIIAITIISPKQESR